MATNKGYLRIPRALFQTEEWQLPREFSRFEAMLSLFEQASYVDGRQVQMARGVVTLQRGQLITTLRFLAKKWGWHKDKVARFLASLESGEMSEKGFTISVSAVSVKNETKNATKTETMRETYNATKATCITIYNYEGNDTEIVINETDVATLNATMTATKSATIIKKEEKERYNHTHQVKDLKGECEGENAPALADKLVAWLGAYYPQLAAMGSPLTAVQAGWILRRYRPADIKFIIDRMDSKEVYRTNKNFYSTFVSFARYEKNITPLIEPRR